MTLYGAHQLDQSVLDFAVDVTAYHARWIGLLRAMPAKSYADVTYSSLWYPTEEHEGYIIPKYRARFPGSASKQLSWMPPAPNGEVDPISHALRWRGLTSFPMTWTCRLDIEPGSGWVPDVVGYFVYTSTPHYLLWVEEFDEPHSLETEGDRMTVTLDVLARCNRIGF